MENQAMNDIVRDMVRQEALYPILFLYNYKIFPYKLKIIPKKSTLFRKYYYFCNCNIKLVSIMDIALSTTNNYWNLLKFLSDDIKLALIAKLSNSIVAKPKEKSVSASDFYGVWKDSDFDMSSDDLANEIKASRTFKDDIEAF